MVKPLRLMAFIRSPFISLHLKAGSSSGLFQPSWPSSSCDWKKREHLPAMENPFRLVGKIWLTSKCVSSFWFSSPPKKSNISAARCFCRSRFNLRQLQTGTQQEHQQKTFQHVGSMFQKCSRYQDISIDIGANHHVKKNTSQNGLLTSGHKLARFELYFEIVQSLESSNLICGNDFLNTACMWAQHKICKRISRQNRLVMSGCEDKGDNVWLHENVAKPSKKQLRSKPMESKPHFVFKKIISAEHH